MNYTESEFFFSEFSYLSDSKRAQQGFLKLC